MCAWEEVTIPLVEDHREYSGKIIIKQRSLPRNSNTAECCKMVVVIGAHNLSKGIIDYAVSEVVQGKLYNQFIKKDLGDYSVRIIIYGINEISDAYKKSLVTHPEITCFEYEIGDDNNFPNAKLAILSGGYSKAPSYFDEAVQQYLQGATQYAEYVEEHLDNPWLRLVIKKQ